MNQVEIAIMRFEFLLQNLCVSKEYP